MFAVPLVGAVFLEQGIELGEELLVCLAGDSVAFAVFVVAGGEVDAVWCLGGLKDGGVFCAGCGVCEAELLDFGL